MPTTRTMSDGTTKTNYSLTETAKIVRQCLKEAFPGVRFSVRGKSYSMGSSINVRWYGGPLTKTVEALVERFADAGSMQIDDYVPTRRHEVSGKPVAFGADYIFCERTIETAVIATIARLSDDDMVRLGFKLDQISGRDLDAGKLVGRDDLARRLAWSFPTWKGTQQPCAYAESVAIVGEC